MVYLEIYQEISGNRHGDFFYVFFFFFLKAIQDKDVIRGGCGVEEAGSEVFSLIYEKRTLSIFYSLGGRIQ